MQQENFDKMMGKFVSQAQKGFEKKANVDFSKMDTGDLLDNMDNCRKIMRFSSQKVIRNNFIEIYNKNPEYIKTMEWQVYDLNLLISDALLFKKEDLPALTRFLAKGKKDNLSAIPAWVLADPVSVVEFLHTSKVGVVNNIFEAKGFAKKLSEEQVALILDKILFTDDGNVGLSGCLEKLKMNNFFNNVFIEKLKSKEINNKIEMSSRYININDIDWKGAFKSCNEQEKLKFAENLLRVSAGYNQELADFIKSDLSFLSKFSSRGMHCVYMNNRTFESYEEFKIIKQHIYSFNSYFTFMFINIWTQMSKKEKIEMLENGRVKDSNEIFFMEVDEEIARMLAPENNHLNNSNLMKEMPKARMVMLVEKNIEKGCGLSTQCFLNWMDNPHFAKAMLDCYGSFTNIGTMFTCGDYDEVTELHSTYLEEVLEKLKE